MLQSDVGRKHLCTLEISEDEIVRKQAGLFEYDVHWAYKSPHAPYLNLTIVCPSVIVEDDGDSTRMILMRILYLSIKSHNHASPSCLNIS